jgi:hypothetical protein
VSPGSIDLFSELSDVYSGIFPTSVSMRKSSVYARPTQVHPTHGSEYSLLPMLKTPTAQLAINGGSQHPRKRKAGGHGPTLADQIEHELP